MNLQLAREIPKLAEQKADTYPFDHNPRVHKLLAKPLLHV